MPAKSTKQQHLMGMVHAAQTGQIKNPSEKVAKLAKSMTKKSASDYASTKHKGLPKKVKKKSIKENMDYENKVGQLHMVQKPSAGCNVASMVYEVDPISGIQQHGVDAQTVHGVYSTPEEAQKVAEKLYNEHMTGMKKLEEKKGTVANKLTTAISKLEKKRKEHMDMAKSDPKSAAEHKQHVSKISGQIEDLMDKLAMVEKSKKPIEEEEDEKKTLKENVGGESLYDSVLNFVKTDKDFSEIKNAVRVTDKGKNGVEAVEVRYGYWNRLPQPYEKILFNNFEYEVESSWDDDKGEIEFYTVTAKKEKEKPVSNMAEADKKISLEEKMVETFLKKIAKEFDYSIGDAAKFVKDTINKMKL